MFSDAHLGIGFELRNTKSLGLDAGGLGRKGDSVHPRFPGVSAHFEFNAPLMHVRALSFRIFDIITNLNQTADNDGNQPSSGIRVPP